MGIRTGFKLKGDRLGGWDGLGDRGIITES